MADSILEAFLNNCEKSPNKLCLSFENQSLSYTDLANRAHRFGAALQEWGLEEGERVALFLENSPDFLAAYLGIFMVGGVVALVNTAYKQVELRHILRDSGARLCFTEQERLSELERVQPDLPELEKIITLGSALEEFLTNEGSFTPRLRQGEELAVLAYTSGTTGRSKGAMLLHRNLISNIESLRQTWGWTENDHLLLTLPLFHAHGLMVGAHGTLTSGASAELKRHFNATEVYDSLLTGQFSMFFGVPTMYTRLLLESVQRAEKPLPLRLYVSGSAPLSAQTFEEFKQVFGQAILERYGMTETIMNMTNPYEGERRPGTVGLPFPGQEARVVDVKTRQPLLPGTDGEIEVRGSHVFKGYWNLPEATAESFSADGWFRTGDLGQMSEDGYYTINGRAKELIITGGYNVYPREVEEVLHNCPGVAEVAVYGLPDADMGEKVAAAIVRNDVSLSEEIVIAFCKDNLASYKKPRQIAFVEALPRNAMGKIQKHLLR
ncbi:AMP-binding protein [Candidatus Chlorohelix sp.]|uniref:AMP-binding protein n=1 Tax=Candidatus Chlorohelix sp. TaxID=3139201 RepID=UPI00303DFED9